MNRRESAEIPPPRLSGFAPAIASLLKAYELPAKRLAAIFGTNSNYINVLAHRGGSAPPHRAAISKKLPGSTEMFSDLDDEEAKVKRALRIRLEEDGVELTRSKAARLAWLESCMEEIVNTGRDTYRYLEAASALRALKPYIGYPSESTRLRLAAKLHQHLAWFYSHSGFTRSSIDEATYSIHLYEIVYRNTEDKDALRELGGSCLIRSNSCLIGGRDKPARATLKLAEDATLSANVALNSEYYQQSGVALFQKGNYLLDTK